MENSPRTGCGGGRSGLIERIRRGEEEQWTAGTPGPDWFDGPEAEMSLSVSWSALPTLRLNGNAGWNWTRPGSEHWRNAGPEASLGTKLTPPEGFTAGLRASVRRTDYEGHGFAHRTIDRQARKDRNRTLTTSVHNRN